MGNNKNIFINFLLSVGAFAILYKIITRRKNKTQIQGIYGLPDALREMIPYEENGEDIFKKEFYNFTPSEIGIILRLIINARKAPNLCMPMFKPFRGSKITGELRDKNIRILIYQIDKDKYILLNAFKKKSNETPKEQIRIAETRLSRYE